MAKFAQFEADLAQVEQYIGEQQHTLQQHVAQNAVDDLQTRLSDFRFDMLAAHHSHHMGQSHQDRIQNCQAQGLRQGGHHCGGGLNYGRTAAQAQQHDCNRKKIHTRLGQNQPACKTGADVNSSRSGTCN